MLKIWLKILTPLAINNPLEVCLVGDSPLPFSPFFLPLQPPLIYPYIPLPLLSGGKNKKHYSFHLPERLSSPDKSVEDVSLTRTYVRSYAYAREHMHARKAHAPARTRVHTRA